VASSAQLTTGATAAPAPDDTSGTLKIGKSDVLTLGDLRDMGMCINQIQQQTINIYMEATRKPVPSHATAHLEDLKAITRGDIDATCRYEPVRPEWMTYYIGVMEPIMQLFQADLDDTKSGATQMIVPKDTVEEFTSMFAPYDNAITQMNQHLDVIHSAVANPHANVKIAQEAVKLYDVTKQLESIRRRAFELLKKSGKKGEPELAPATAPCVPQKSSAKGSAKGSEQSRSDITSEASP
jgi:hypothetical protein